MEIERVGDLADALREASKISLSGSDTHAKLRRGPAQESMAIKIRISGVVRHDSADQVVVCKGNTSWEELQTELKSKRQCIPYLPFLGLGGDSLEGVQGTIAGHLSMNLPHSFEAAHGSWKDWLLGAKVMLADGLAAKCGSQVVKNVAGYDLHKLLIGVRGTVAVITEMTLRTFPVKALELPDLEVFPRELPRQGVIERSLPSDFGCLRERYETTLLALHPRTSTLYRSGTLHEPGGAGTSSWALGWGNGAGNIPVQNETYRRYFARLKQSFDPGQRLNPGEWGEI